MKFEFNSLDELKARITPALNAKETEFKRLGYKNVSSEDIWEYLSTNIWSKSTGLELVDMISDIMNLEPRSLVKLKESRGQDYGN